MNVMRFPPRKSSTTQVREFDRDSLEQVCASSFNWKPLLFRTRYLFLILFFLLGTVTLVEYLLRRSLAHDGLIDETTYHKGAWLFLRYVPTIIGVVVIELSAVINDEAKLLQPYLNLSRPGGATGQQSLLLNYDNWWALFKALWARDWLVTLTELLYLLAAGIAAPAQSSFFMTNVVRLKEEFSYSQPQKDWSIVAENYNKASTGNFRLDAILNMNAPIAAWTTTKFVAMPIPLPKQISSKQTGAGNERINVETMVFAADVNCMDNVEVIPYEEIVSDKATQFYAKAMYLNFTDPMRPVDCPRERVSLYRVTSNKFFSFWQQSLTSNPDPSWLSDVYEPRRCNGYITAGWAKPTFVDNRNPKDDTPNQELSTLKANWTVLSCKLFYTKSNMTVSVDRSGNLIVNETEFEKRAENYESEGFDLAMNSYASLLFLRKANQTQLLTDHEVLKATIRDSVTFGFTQSFITIVPIGAKGEQSISRVGILEYDSRRIVVNDISARVIQAVYGLFSFMAVSLMIYTTLGNFRRLHFRWDMGSLVAQTHLLFTSGLLSEFEGIQHDRHTETTLKHLIGGNRYIFERGSLSVVSKGLDSIKPDSENKSHKSSSAWIPVFLRLRYLGPVALFFTGLVAFLVALYFKGTLDSTGIPIPSGHIYMNRLINFDARQFIARIVPTLIAALVVRPLWLAIDEALKRLSPYIGPAPALRTILLDYSATFSGIVAVKAFMKKHWLLAMAGFITLLSQLLTVGSGNLFDFEPVELRRDINVRHVWQLRSSGYDVNASNISPTNLVKLDLYHVPALPWTTAEYSFLPVEYSIPPEATLTNQSTIIMKTTALKANLTCRDALVSNDYAININFQPAGTRVIYKLLNKTTTSRVMPFNGVNLASIDATLVNPIGGKVCASVEDKTFICGRRPAPASNRTPNEGVCGRWSLMPWWFDMYWQTGPAISAQLNDTSCLSNRQDHFLVEWVEGTFANYEFLTKGTKWADREYQMSRYFFTQKPNVKVLACKPRAYLSDAILRVKPESQQVISYNIINEREVDNMQWTEQALTDQIQLLNMPLPQSLLNRQIGFLSFFSQTLGTWGVNDVPCDARECDIVSEPGISSNMISYLMYFKNYVNTEKSINSKNELIFETVSGLANAASDAYQEIFAVWAYTTKFLYQNGTVPKEAIGTISTVTTKNVVNNTALLIVLAVLVSAIALIVLNILWRRNGLPILPLEPKSIAARLSLTYRSDLVDDLYGTEEFATWEEMERHFEKKRKLYRVGMWVGDDNNVYSGIVGVGGKEEDGDDNDDEDRRMRSENCS